MSCSGRLLCVLVVAVSLVAGRISAQGTSGAPPFGSLTGGPDLINVANLNVHQSFPVRHKAGRGLPFNFDLSVDTSLWQRVTSGSSTTWQPVSGWGWGGSALNVGAVGYTETVNSQYISYCNFIYYDGFGTGHGFAGCATYYANGTDVQLQAIASDSSGYTISVDAYYGTFELVSAEGNHIFPQNLTPVNPATRPGSVEDRNGNEITGTTTGTSGNYTTTYVDTLGTTALTITGGNPNPYRLTYPSPAGASASVAATFRNYTVKTNFGCAGVAEYGPTIVSMVDRITLADGSYYQFGYEPTPGFSGDITGRLASVMLPTGGTISYQFTGSNNGIVCADGTAAGLRRTTADGSWNYSRTLGSGAASTTTVTDPQGNITLIQFQGIYETQRTVYQGTIAGTRLKTTTTCYNGNTLNCPGTPITLPITRRTVFVGWPSSGQFGNDLQSRKDTIYNAYGWLTETDDYGYGAGAPGVLVRKTLNTYASLSNGIANKPRTVTVQDGSGNIKAQTTYTYDVGTLSVTSGTPQHVAVSGARGNLTSVASLVGAQSLTKNYTYYDTGAVWTERDVNGAQTTYIYGACGNSFPTSISRPLGLSRSQVWNCVGGVETSETDENGQTTIYGYNTDPYFWRINSKIDKAFSTTNYSYLGATGTESSMVFNSGASTVDVLSMVDSLGRAKLSQTKQGPNSSTYDSVETDYDSVGRPRRITLPYAGTFFQTNASAPSTITAYDSLGRKTSITDGGGGYLLFGYFENDATEISGPAPSGENQKQKRLEYDSLGRLISVCEITAGVGSGTCSQSASGTGYWTKYTYDLLNDLTSVTQNAQSSSNLQTRTYTYDGKGRLTSETNPETGSIQNFYDTDPGTVGMTTCPGAYNGDLVKSVDAQGNVTCYTYDALHRMTSAAYHGPYGSVTPNKYFVYDAGVVNGVAMLNVKDRRAEAYTCFLPCTTKITDTGFSYTARGEISDVYQSTPHSGGYYRVTAGYWLDGLLHQLSNLSGLPTITYNVDGEGRVFSVSASSGQNPVTNTIYNVAGKPTLLSLGSLDTDSFSYDPTTQRTTQFQFSVNNSSLVGNLTWNAVGTLGKLVVSDPFFSGGNLTCTYSHDDLTRIASANCGAAWSQTFNYDVFGNISKSGTMSFLPIYSPATNRMTSIGNGTPSYDTNGNVTNDFLHNYTWDAANRPVTIDGVGAIYDALGRMVEQVRGSTYSQIVYAPSGRKLAIMQGQTLVKAFVALPAGATAVYTSAGLNHYRHADWLGSARLGSTPARAVSFNVAYAPFGESYAQSGTPDLSFTGMNQDTVANLYDFPAREYGIQGRWPSPDPAGLLSLRSQDPQSLNRYAYVRNNPLVNIDPTGLDGECDPLDPFCGGGGCDPSDPLCGGGGPIGGPNPLPPPPPPPSAAPTTCDPSESTCHADCEPEDPTCGGSDSGNVQLAVGDCGGASFTAGSSPGGSSSCFGTTWTVPQRPKHSPDNKDALKQCLYDCGEDFFYAQAVCWLLIEEPPGFVLCYATAAAIEKNCEKRCRKEFPVPPSPPAPPEEWPVPK